MPCMGNFASAALLSYSFWYQNLNKRVKVQQKTQCKKLATVLRIVCSKYRYEAAEEDEMFTRSTATIFRPAECFKSVHAEAKGLDGQ